MRLRIARQRELPSDPGVHEVAPDQVPNRIVRHRRVNQVADLQTGDHHPNGEGQLEKNVSAGGERKRALICHLVSIFNKTKRSGLPQ